MQSHMAGQYYPVSSHPIRENKVVCLLGCDLRFCSLGYDPPNLTIHVQPGITSGGEYARDTLYQVWHTAVLISSSIAVLWRSAVLLQGRRVILRWNILRRSTSEDDPAPASGHMPKPAILVDFFANDRYAIVKYYEP